MLQGLFGEIASVVLLYLCSFRDGYVREIADTFDLTPSAVQKQLVRLEREGVLVSQLRGNMRFFEFNPRYPFLKELRALLRRAMDYMPMEQKILYGLRKRPRRTGKPL